jgi:hypothetical protein
MQAHRYGDQRLKLARDLAEISPDNVRQAVRKHLSAGKVATCVLNPSAEPESR